MKINTYRPAGDAGNISIAESKVHRLGLNNCFIQGLSCDIPLDNNFCDRCLSSLFFHHLDITTKEKLSGRYIMYSSREGSFISLIGAGRPGVNAFLFYQIQLPDGMKTTSDNSNGILPDLMVSAGFNRVKIVDDIPDIFGTMTS